MGIPLSIYKGHKKCYLENHSNKRINGLIYMINEKTLWISSLENVNEIPLLMENIAYDGIIYLFLYSKQLELQLMTVERFSAIISDNKRQEVFRRDKNNDLASRKANIRFLTLLFSLFRFLAILVVSWHLLSLLDASCHSLSLISKTDFCVWIIQDITFTALIKIL